MSDIDPYKHIRALARSIATTDIRINDDVPECAAAADAAAEPPPPTGGARSEHGIRSFAETLRAARERRELTQRELGRLAGVPQSHISKIESGVVDLRLSSLLALAAVLDLELALTERAPATRVMRGDAVTTAASPPRSPARIAAVRPQEPTAEPVLVQTATQ